MRPAALRCLAPVRPEWRIGKGTPFLHGTDYKPFRPVCVPLRYSLTGAAGSPNVPFLHSNGTNGEPPPYNCRMDFDSAYYREAVSLIRRGRDPLQALQLAARKRGRVVAVPLALAEFLMNCTTGEAVSLISRAADRAADRERGTVLT